MADVVAPSVSHSVQNRKTFHLSNYGVQKVETLNDAQPLS